MASSLRSTALISTSRLGGYDSRLCRRRLRAGSRTALEHSSPRFLACHSERRDKADTRYDHSPSHMRGAQPHAGRHRDTAVSFVPGDFVIALVSGAVPGPSSSRGRYSDGQDTLTDFGSQDRAPRRPEIDRGTKPWNPLPLSVRGLATPPRMLKKQVESVQPRTR